MKTLHTSQRHLRYCLLFVLLLSLSLALPQDCQAAGLDFLDGPTNPAFQQQPGLDFLASGSGPIGCGSPSSKTALGAIDLSPSTRLLFYSIPADQLEAGKNEVEVKVWVDDQVFLSEVFVMAKRAVEAIQERSREQQRSELGDLDLDLDLDFEKPVEDSGSVVFELLGDRPELRAELVLLGEGSAHAVDIEVVVNGQGVVHQAFHEFSSDSAEAVSRHGLPVVAKATAQAFPISTKPQQPQGFEVCGDGICAGGMPPLGENCESCPVDCGGACSICGNGYCGGTERCFNCEADCGVCQNCPTDLGNAIRTQYLGSQSLGLDCRAGGAGPTLYDFLRNDYKRWTVHKTEECDGTITETIVPGTTSFFSLFCYAWVGLNCPFPNGVASPLCSF
ncbi:MAG: heterocycloanthracin/sonorensin family bacteriocin [Deltaproteobacteria bacterium]|nr:heterocycloanthracin/sonorensin family bacteriocin [Deltaproteobacteria bacterium]